MTQHYRRDPDEIDWNGNISFGKAMFLMLWVSPIVIFLIYLLYWKAAPAVASIKVPVKVEMEITYEKEAK